MNTDQISGLIRTVLAAIGGIFIGKGWVNAENWAWIVGGLATALPAAWSWWSNRPAAMAAGAQKIEGVNVQVSASAPAGVKAAVANIKGS